MQENSYPKLNQKMISHTLANGLKICIFPKKGFKRAYAILAVNYGAIDTSFKVGGESFTSPLGVAHFLEHKVFEQPDGGNALQAFAKTGASPNAFTGKNMTAYYFSGTEKFTRNLEILLGFVTTPYFTDENVRKEQGIIGQEIGMVNDRPGWRVYENLMQSLYQVHPARNSIIGTIESINQITRDILFGCYNTFYVPSNMTLCVGGDVNPEKVIETAEAILPKSKAKIPEKEYAFEPCGVAQSRIEETAEIAIPQFAIGIKTALETSGEEGMRNRILADISADLLAGPSSALYAKLYSDGIITSDFGAEFMFFPKNAALMISGESRDPDLVLSEVKKYAEKMSKDIDTAYFERIKKSYLGMKLRSLDKVKTLCNEQIEAVFAEYDYLDSIDIINEIEPSEVSMFIKKLFRDENIALSIVKGK